VYSLNKMINLKKLLKEEKTDATSQDVFNALVKVIDTPEMERILVPKIEKYLKDEKGFKVTGMEHTNIARNFVYVIRKMKLK